LTEAGIEAAIPPALSGCQFAISHTYEHQGAPCVGERFAKSTNELLLHRHLQGIVQRGIGEVPLPGPPAAPQTRRLFVAAQTARAKQREVLFGRMLALAVGPATFSKPLAERTVREGAWVR
jgi:hypothetical protein